jgi:transcriptional regulator with XRE-family HTH domain
VPIDDVPLPVLTYVGDVVRTTRIRFAWSQRELSRRSGVPQSQISELERSRITDMRLSDLVRILSSLGVRYRLILDPPITERRSPGDLVHAWCSAHVERRLVGFGWRVAREVEIGGDRSRGWIDVLAWHPDTRVLLVIEIKSELHDIGAIERTMNWYQREAWTAARRLGWQPARVGSALLLLDSEVNDRAIAINRAILGSAFPQRAEALARLISGDAEIADGRFLAMIDPRSHRGGGIRRARVDGRRAAAPYVDYIDAVRAIESGSSGAGVRPRLAVPRGPHE